MGGVFGAAGACRLWPIVIAAEVVGREKGEEGLWLAIVKGKRRKSNSKISLCQQLKLEPSSACTIIFSRKCILALIRLVIKLMSSIEVSMVHIDTTAIQRSIYRTCYTLQTSNKRIAK